MRFKDFRILIFIFACLTAGCKQEDELCGKLGNLPEDSLLTMSGRVLQGPDGDYLFDTESKAEDKSTKYKTVLHFCAPQAGKLVDEMYPAYIREENSENDMWVKISGRYAPVNSRLPPVFLVTFLTLISKDEAGKVDEQRRTDERVKTAE